MAATEFKRLMKRKRIRFSGWNGDPTNPLYVDIPVIVEIEFRDHKTDSQEYHWHIDNGEKASRKLVETEDGMFRRVKQATLDYADPDTVHYDRSFSVFVERIKETTYIDHKTNSQETAFRPRNLDPPPMTPEGDTGDDKKHRKSHFVRYTKNNRVGVLGVDVELLDEIEFGDQKTSGQESIYYLKHPKIEDLEKITDHSDPYAVNADLYRGFCDPDLELIEERVPVDGIIDPPYRLDPFQNIVNIVFDKVFTIEWAINLTFTRVGPVSCEPPLGSGIGTYEGTYVSSCLSTLFYTPVPPIFLPPDTVIVNGASLSGGAFTFDPWIVPGDAVDHVGFAGGVDVNPSLYVGNSSILTVYSRLTGIPESIFCVGLGPGPGTSQVHFITHDPPGVPVGTMEFHIGSTTVIVDSNPYFYEGAFKYYLGDRFTVIVAARFISYDPALGGPY